MKYPVTQFRLLICAILMRWMVFLAPADDPEGQMVLMSINRLGAAMLAHGRLVSK